MRLNTQSSLSTHEGAPAPRISPEQELRRSVLSCLLWENNAYEDGVTIAERIERLCGRVSPEFVASLAIEAREKFHLRHAPLLLLCGLIKHGRGRLVSDTIFEVIRRPDEMGELLAIYWRDQRRPLSNQLKKGLARAFQKFNSYQLAKYNNRDTAVKLRDVLFLCHAKPADEEQASLWKSLIDGTLPPPDTWEVALSAGLDKKETFERLLREGALGYLALLRNLRNMEAAGVDRNLIKTAILSRRGASKVLPFRFCAAARAVPSLENTLDIALLAGLADLPELSGNTICLVDVSGSMQASLSRGSEMTFLDAAATLASVINCEHLRVFSFSDGIVEVPPRRGMAGIDAISNSQQHGGTRLGAAVAEVNGMPHDRLIVITDEQSFDPVPPPVASRAYLINVANNQRGVGYGNGWIHIDGFSENVIRYIAELEST
jgi:60 kDa SS-A/Ro ribonucleoprotein